MTSLPRPASQRGVATLLILLLVALAVTVTVLIVAYTLRGTQQRQLTVHSATAAQGAAWRGVEVLRTGLLVVPAEQLLAWSEGSGWDEFDQGSVIPVAGGGSSQGGGSSGASGGAGAAPWTETCNAGPARGAVGVSGMGSIGITGARLVEVCRTAAQGSYRVTAQVTGSAGAGTAATTSTVEAVYEVAPATAGGIAPQPQVCGGVPGGAMVFNGDLNYTGGRLDVQNPQQNLENVAVNGNISIGNGSQAKISGCAKGNITLGGGGIADSARLYAEGDISVNSMSPPVNADFWARNITIGNSGSGTYQWIRAGGFQVQLVSAAGGVVGSAVVGGTLHSSGHVLPPVAGRVAITLADGSAFLLDLSRIEVATSGMVSVPAGAASRLSGTGAMPDSFRFVRTGEVGGAINIHQLRVTTLWGNRVQLNLDGGAYKNTWAHSDLRVLRRSSLGTVAAGGDLVLTGDTSPSNLPVVDGGRIGGQVRPAGAAVARLATGVADASPGLPGIPHCDARVDTVDVASLKGQANYVFYFDPATGDPMLLLQNMKRSDNDQDVPAGPYNLRTQDMRTLFGNDFLQCGWYNSHCGRDVSRANGWEFTGIYRWPPGVMYFEGAVKLNNSQQSTLYNGVLATGAVTLGNSSVTLSAPNLSPVSAICSGPLYPANLCDKSGGTPKFTTWTDADGREHSGLPIGNMAVLTERGMAASQWTIRGNVVLGEQVQTSGAVLSVYGTVTVGANRAGSPTTVSAGGFNVQVPTDSGQLFTPLCEIPEVPVPATAQSVRLLWSRYR